MEITLLILVLVMASLGAIGTLNAIFQSSQTQLKKWHSRTIRDVEIQKGTAYIMLLVWIAIIVLASLILQNNN